jgi:serine/threonine protein kinase/tetratricopeptide (TPR) repeat protein
MTERDLFEAALELPPEDRGGYLDGVCGGDAALRQRLEALLSRHDRAGSFLESPALRPVATVDEPVSERPGTVIGPYKLLEQIGEGGMGLVFVAEQQQPVRRKVALKVIKPGMDTRQVVARFEAERQALALMDHPNIARVFDGGETQGGRPYFVMELVKGMPVTDFCDQNQVPIRERLELFRQVCQAIQHAHQKGLIHRDIKPSNVLVTSHDGTPLVKVIDFGVAKALGQQLTDKTVYTQSAQLVGTPLYMSPEQAGQSGRDVDTRSDIYSLGVLLYELLTGATPFDRERFRQADFDEIRRIVREEEPARPSTRVSTLGQASTVAMKRKSDPRRLSRLLRGELDWVVMKALEKDRERRYESASAFARDVDRYLANEPVQACPPSAGYRLRKFARRNRREVMMGGVLALAAVLAVGALGWAVRDREARQVEAEKDRAARQVKEDQERAAREAGVDRKADEALVEAIVHLNRGDWPKARASLEQAGWVLAAGGSGAARRRLTQTSADLATASRLEDIRLGPPNAFFHNMELEAAQRREAVKDYPAAFKHYGIDVVALDPAAAAAAIREAAIRRQLAAALDDWLWSRRISIDDAERWLPFAQGGDPKELAKLKNVIQRLSAEYEHLRAVADLTAPNELCRRIRDPRVQQDRQALAALAGRPEIADLPPAAATLLARLLNRAGEVTRAVEVLSAVQRRSPDDFLVNRELALLLRWPVGGRPARVEEAISFMRAAVALRPNFWTLRLGLADLLRQARRLDQAIAEYRRVIEIYPKWHLTYDQLASALEETGNLGEAIAVRRQLVAQVTEPSADLVGLDAGAVGLLSSPSAAGPLLAVSVCPLIAQETTRYTVFRTGKLMDLGRACGRAGRWGEAVAAFQEALHSLPNDAFVQSETAWLLANCPEPKFRDPAEAIRLANLAAGRQPKELDGRVGLTIGVARYRAGDMEGALAALEKASVSSQPLGISGWGALWAPEVQRTVFMAMAHWKQGERELALEDYRTGSLLATSTKNYLQKLLNGAEG